MDRCVRSLVWVSLLLFVVWNVGCTCAQGKIPISDGGSTTTTSGGGGAGGDDLGPCGVDCSKFETPQCTVAVCNVGQVVGPLYTCIVVPQPNGSECDDGKFCTVSDACDNGACTGGTQNQCGEKSSPCVAVVCYEDSKSCDVSPVNDGAGCTPTDLCQVDGACVIGECIGVPKDCSFSPLNECNSVACDSATGKCTGTPDLQKDDTPCFLTGELCNLNRTCKAGQCGGGTPKDCSALDVGCHLGSCDANNGACVPIPAPPGTLCTEGLHECDVGACDVKGTCVASQAPNGMACNDHDACSKTDVCQAGVCSGIALAGCSHYLQEGFESCPNGWTFGGDWQCGTPTNVGPLEAHTGTGVIATQIAAVYHVNQAYATTVADSPPIDLTAAVNPMLSFWAWDKTEGGTFDGWNLKVSTNGGSTFTQVTTVTPPYDLTIATQAAWGGDHSAESWQLFSADLTAYAGKSIILRFAFRSDGATVFPGVYIDDVVVAEPLQSPLFITTDSPLTDVYTEMAYSAQISKTGGTNASVWSIKAAGVNKDWITIDPATGMLSGVPSKAQAGPVSFTVHVEEPSLPSNFAEKTFTFTVNDAVYYTSFEGACPAGWTLTGDWQCGAPTVVGPAAAFVGTQCLGTQLAGPYSNSQTFAGTTATSPDIDLDGVGDAKLTFRMWIDTEGSTFDGVNLQVSTDGGMTYTILSSVVPVYPLTVAGKPAWGGHQGALDWQPMQADLAAFAGQTIRVRFAFQSDASGTFPGVYIDDFFIN